jgi:anti-sigma factor RsiW
VDLKAYFLGEVQSAERPRLEAHVRSCGACNEELDRMKATQAALLALSDEEPPQRIAFVSDKVFEPRWYQGIWRSGPAMGFASAAVLAAAIVVHGSSGAGGASPGKVDTAQIEQRIEREVSVRLDAAVAKAVNDAETRQSREVANVLETAEKRYAAQREADLAAAQQTISYYEKKMNRWLVASNEDVRPAQ